MKVLVRSEGQVYQLDHVGLDDKCLPVVAGIPPYDEKWSRDTTPLVFESVLWFKTLAMEAIYIDCQQRLVYWTPLASTHWTPLASTQEIQTQTSPEITSGKSDFVPTSAKPLFTDNSVYDFDASPKEMMMMCSQVSRKLSKKSLSADEFHKSIARILHVYILPKIMFTRDDIFCLSQAKSQIDKRLYKAEASIKNCATVAENLKDCLNRMVSQLLHKENMDNENYIRTCKKDFLVAFLKVLTLDIDNLNIELSAAQSNVNWARDHGDGPQHLADLKKRRDQLFQKIDERIMAREAIKNVIMRAKLTKRKAQKCVVIKSCVHNVFVEVLRKLEEQDHILRELGQDKVSICAAREAVLSTIEELQNSSHNSDQPAQFELHNFVDCLLMDGKNLNKPNDWLTLEERVAMLLKDKVSVSCMYNESGCKELTSEIHHILNGLLAAPKSINIESIIYLQNSPQVDPSFHLSLNDVTIREQRFTEKTPHKYNDVVINAGENGDLPWQQPVTGSQKIRPMGAAEVKYTAENQSNHAINRRGPSRSRSDPALQNSQFELCDVENLYRLQRRMPVTFWDDLVEQITATDELVQSDAFSEEKLQHNDIHDIVRQQPREINFLESIDSLKDLMQVHFMEMIECLNYELKREDNWEISFQEQQELLWKSYEHFFCEKLYSPLIQLYKEGLTPSMQQAYTTVCGIPLEEILKDDKLLDLFFAESISDSRTGSNISVPCTGCSDSRTGSNNSIPCTGCSDSRTGSNSIPCMGCSDSRTAPISIACTECSDVQDLTYHGLVARPCSIRDLNFLVSTDGNYHHESYLDSTKIDEDGGKVASCDLFLSVTPSIDEGFGASSCSFSSSVQSDFTVASLDEDIMDNFGKWKIQSSPEQIREMLDPVLSHFRMYVTKCLNSYCFLDKVRYITKAVEILNKNISQMIGPDYQSACDDILSMLVLALCYVSEDMFVDLYVNLRLLMDVLPSFLSGSLWDYSLVSLCASYDYLFTLRTL